MFTITPQEHLAMTWIWTHNFRGEMYWLHRLIQLTYDHDQDGPDMPQFKSLSNFFS
jgi:hypothetical protein